MIYYVGVLQSAAPMHSHHFIYKSRHVGMADDADSKSVVGNHVWVQVPLPALKNSVTMLMNDCMVTEFFVE